MHLLASTFTNDQSPLTNDQLTITQYTLVTQLDRVPVF